MEFDLSAFLRHFGNPNEIENVRLLLDYTGASGLNTGNLRLFQLDAEGDGSVNALDADAPATLLQQYEFGTALPASGRLGGAFGIDLM